MNVNPVKYTHQFKKISVIGLGYIGLPTAAMIASRGLQVVGIDIDPNVISMINDGKIHIVEPDLDILVKSVVTTGHLRAALKPEPADAFLITVPTPFKEHHVPDLSYIEAAVASIAPVLAPHNLIVLESTSPVGTTAAIAEKCANLRPDLVFPHQASAENPANIHIAYCPERVMPGQIIRELIENDRIIGGMTPACTEMACQIYQLFVKGECITTDDRTAEMVKLTENAFRDVNIAFANELSMICDQQKINVWQLIKLANRHPRVNILQPGPGVGGHCLAVDPWFIVHASPNEANLIRTARRVNLAKTEHIVEKIKAVCAAFHKVPTVAYLGLTYKANTNDLRESPALHILEELAFSTRFPINIVEPHITELPTTLKDHSRFQLQSLDEALSQADIVIIMVAHASFKTLLNDDALSDKMILDIVNLNTQISGSHANVHTNKNTPEKVSDYGLMMMNRIYGNILR